MTRNGLFRICFLNAITMILLVSSVTDFVLEKSKTIPFAPAPIPYQINEWQGKDVLPRLPAVEQAKIKKLYEPLDVRLTWRFYKKTEQPRIESLVQQATNFDNLHDIYRCMELEGIKPKSLGIVQLKGTIPLAATLVEYQKNNKKYCALFCYQSQAMTAIYPARNLYEQALLAIVGRVPCRLVQVTTLLGENRTDTIDSVKKFASTLCATPI